MHVPFYTCSKEADGGGGAFGVCENNSKEIGAHSCRGNGACADSIGSALGDVKIDSESCIGDESCR